MLARTRSNRLLTSKFHSDRPLANSERVETIHGGNSMAVSMIRSGARRIGTGRGGTGAAFQDRWSADQGSAITISSIGSLRT
jgi:hypothetical protein